MAFDDITKYMDFKIKSNINIFKRGKFQYSFIYLLKVLLNCCNIVQVKI